MFSSILKWQMTYYTHTTNYEGSNKLDLTFLLKWFVLSVSVDWLWQNKLKKINV